MTLTVEPLDAALGARVTGLDTGRPPDAEALATLRRALLEHLAIVIDDLPEEPAWLLEVGRHFGPLVPHMYRQFHHPVSAEISIIAANTGTKESRQSAKPAGAFWHSDLSYKREPSDAIFLYASILPSRGGDTLMANMVAAYEGLPPALRERLEGLTALHYWRWNTGGASLTLSPEEEKLYPIVEHPVVRVHPQSGRRSLFVNPGYTMCIKGMDEKESERLLAELFEHALQPRFTYRHKWRKGQLVGLDNRATMHAAVADYDEPRRMLRMIVGCTDPRFLAA